ncbi:MAG: phage major capsid protein [Oscillospiraceae bacterium]
MNREEYLNKRQSLINQAEKSIQDGNLDDYKTLENKIKELDTKFEDESKAQANLNALSNNAIGVQSNKINSTLNLQNDSVSFDNITDDTIYENAFTKVMMNKHLSDNEQSVFNKINSLENNTTEKNAYLVPTTWLNQIWSEAEESHPVLNHVKCTSVPGDYDIPKAEIIDNAEFYDEDTPVCDSEIKSEDIHLKGYELAKSVSASWKLQKMAVPEFQAWLKTKIAKIVGNTKARSYIMGKGVASSSDGFKSQPLGVITSLKAEIDTPQIMKIPVDNKVSYEDITYLVSLVKSEYAKQSKFYANNTFIWRVLANVTNSKGDPIFISDPTGQVVGRIFGKEVCEESAVPDNNLIFGNFMDCYTCNNQQDITLYQEENIKSRKTDFMAYSIYDSQPMTNKAFALLIKETE